MKRFLSIATIVFGVGITVLWVAMWATKNDTGQFRCARADADCVLVSKGGATQIPRASIQKVYVSHSRGTGWSLKLVTASATTILGGSTLHGDSKREYDKAAREATEFLEGHTDSVDVTYTHRVGVAQLIVGVLFGGLLIGAGVVALRKSRATK